VQPKVANPASTISFPVSKGEQPIDHYRQPIESRFAHIPICTQVNI
jgi:hypothetical protein